jgi:uncharacterized membrane protein
MTSSLWMWLALLGLLSWGTVGVFQKMAVERIGLQRAFFWVAAGFMLLQPAVLPATYVLNYSSESLICALLNGLCNGLGILCFMAAMRHGGKASIVESLGALYPVLVVLLSPFLLRERLSALHVLGVACAAVAGILLSAESPATN